MKRVSSAPVNTSYDPGSSRTAGTGDNRPAGPNRSNNPFLRSRRESTTGEPSSVGPAYQHAATQTDTAQSVHSPASVTAAARTGDAHEAPPSVTEAVSVLNRLRQSFPALLDQATEVRHIAPVDNVRMFVDRALADATGQIDQLLQQQGLRADLRAPMVEALKREVHQAFDEAARTFDDARHGRIETHSGYTTDVETQALLGHQEASRAASTRAASPQSDISASQAARPAESRAPSETRASEATVDPLAQVLRDRGVDEQRAAQLASGLRHMSALQRRETAPAAMQTLQPPSDAAPPDASAPSRARTFDPDSLEARLANRGGMSEADARRTADAFRAMANLRRSQPSPES